MKNISLDKIIYIFILIIMVGIPLFKLATYIPFISNINSDFILMSRVYFFWGSIIFMLFTYLYSIFSKSRNINFIDYLFYFLIFSLFISTIFSVDINKSIFGENLRYDGLLTILNYYLIVLNVKNLSLEKYKKNIIKCFVIIGICQVIYGFLQSFTPFTYMVGKFLGGSHMAMGLCSNPNFFGAYMAMLLSIITIYYIKTGKIKYLIVYMIFTFGLYLSSSSGPVLGYLLSFTFFCFLFRKEYRRIVVLLVLLSIVFSFTDVSLRYVHSNNEIADSYMVSSDVTDSIEKIRNNNIRRLGNGRFDLWINTLPLVRKYWLTGSGLDTFGNVYPQNGELYYDKAHNIYLQMAVTNGIFPLFVYLFICLYVFLKGLKLKETYFISIYMAFVSYCILGFVNISVIDVAPYFYIILGLLISDLNILNCK